MKLIAIAGGSASGKSTLAKHLGQALNALVISHDDYYNERLPEGVESWDDPLALDTGLLCRHLDALRRGEHVSIPVYDFETGKRVNAVDVGPRWFVVVEGLFVLADERIRERADLTVYVDAPDDIRLARRIRRDVAERGRTADSVINRWLAHVRPGHERYVAPSAAYADIVVSGKTVNLGDVLEALK